MIAGRRRSVRAAVGHHDVMAQAPWTSRKKTRLRRGPWRPTGRRAEPASPCGSKRRHRHLRTLADAVPTACSWLHRTASPSDRSNSALDFGRQGLIYPANTALQWRRWNPGLATSAEVQLQGSSEPQTKKEGAAVLQPLHVSRARQDSNPRPLGSSADLDVSVHATSMTCSAC